MLPLVDELVKALESERVSYCHWKSNASLLQAAAGEEDLDLLVGHRSRQAFLEVLARLGFKEAVPAKGLPRIPGISSYFGYDEKAGRMVHIHAHDKLVLGHDLTKNYHLPIEDAYLASSVTAAPFRVPAPELEFAVFIVRMTLKYSNWSAILAGRPPLSARERRELEIFLEDMTGERAGQSVAAFLPSLGPALLDLGLRALLPRASVRSRARAGRRMHAALRGCRIRPRIQDIWLQCWRRIAWPAKSRLLKKVPRKTLKNGGLLVGFIGGDGAGKTTVIEGAAAWISPCFSTAKVHLGKPRWSVSTVLVRGLLKIGRSLRLWSFTNVPLDVLDDEHPIEFPGYPPLIRAVCTARDRWRTFVKARRLADKGRLVICDRFPLPGLIRMDGPRVGWMTRASKTNRFIRALARIEERCYRSISPPDLLIVLRVDPETAVERKSEDNAESVRVRTSEIWKKDWAGSGAQVIDAGQSQDEVLQKTKALIWAHL